jgi:hypothetical protein
MKTNKLFNPLLVLALVFTATAPAWAARTIPDGDRSNSSPSSNSSSTLSDGSVSSVSDSSSSVALHVLATVLMTGSRDGETKKSTVPSSDASSSSSSQRLFDEMQAALSATPRWPGSDIMMDEEEIMGCNAHSAHVTRTGYAYASYDFVVFRKTIFRVKFGNKDKEVIWRRISAKVPPFVHASFTFGEVPDGTCELSVINWPKFDIEGKLGK